MATSPSINSLRLLPNSLRSGLTCFLYGVPSRKMLRQELILVGFVCAVFLYLEKDLLRGAVTYTHDSLLWYAMFHYFGESLWQGFWPLWNPYVHGGEPFHYAWGILRLLDPITLLTLGVSRLFNPSLFDLYHYNYVIRILVTVGGLYGVFRHLLKRFLSLQIVLVVSLWGYLGSSALADVGPLDAFCWFPWAFLCLLRMLDPATQRRGITAVGFSYFLGITVGASVYHWAFPVFVITLFTVSLFVNRREDLRRLVNLDRKLWLASVVLFLALAAPLISLAPERPQIAPVVRLYDRDKQVSWLTRVLGMGYDDIAQRSPIVGLGSYAFARNIFKLTPHYESPETSYVAKVLLIVGLVFGRHRYKFNLLGVGLLTLVLYAGPVPPFHFLHQLLYFSFPPLWLVRHLSVFDPFIYFFVLFYIGLGADRCLGWLAPATPLDSAAEVPTDLSLPVRDFALPSSGLNLSRFPSAREVSYVVATFVATAGFYWVLPLQSNFFNHLYAVDRSSRLFIVTALSWALFVCLFYRILRRVRHAIPILLVLSILVVEQWTIGTYLHLPRTFSWTDKDTWSSKKQERARYFEDFRFPERAAKAFSFPSHRVAGLNLKKSYLSYAPTLFHVNTALEDLLPPRGSPGTPHVFPGFFRMNFPFGLYHFWPQAYLRLYEIGESRPEVFKELMGIEYSVLAFYPHFVAMDEEEQQKFFRQGRVDQVYDSLRRAVFIAEPLPEEFKLLAVTPDEAIERHRGLWNGSFEAWTAEGVPAQWSYFEGGRGGRVARTAERENVKEGEMAAVIYPSSVGPSFIRYSIPGVGQYRGRYLMLRVWAKSGSTVPDAVQIVIETGAEGNPVMIKSYGNSGEWEELWVGKVVEEDARYLLVSLSVSSQADHPGYFDAVEVRVTKPLEKIPFDYKVISYVPSRLEMEVNAERDGVLLFRDNHHPHWGAFIDGSQARLLRANLAFKALPLPKGKHRVLFEYRPVGFLLALYTYLAANAVLLLVACGALLRKVARRS